MLLEAALQWPAAQVKQSNLYIVQCSFEIQWKHYWHVVTHQQISISILFSCFYPGTMYDDEEDIYQITSHLCNVHRIS